jgi:hypothetical protein
MARLYGALAHIQSGVLFVTRFCVIRKCMVNNHCEVKTLGRLHLPLGEVWLPYGVMNAAKFHGGRCGREWPA